MLFITTSKLPRSILSVSLRTVVTGLCLSTFVLAGQTAWAAKPHAVVHAASGKAIDFDAFNNATDSPVLRSGNKGPAVARAQILLNRAWFSCGEIDGRFASNMQRVVRAYQAARGLKVTGTVTAETWASLREGSAAFLTRYAVTEKDLAGPFEPTPVAMDERAKMKALVYESADEALAEKFHTSIAYLKQLNGARKIETAQEIVVPNVLENTTPVKAASIQIDKTERVLYVLDIKQRPVAAFPISIGNEKDDPLPLGVMAIKNEIKNPTYTYNPALLKNAPKDAQKVDIAAGPNNPVGSMWLGLSKPHWGIHGTPSPSNVGHSETNGCIHLTNWDAERLATLVKPGFKVDVKS